MGMPAASAAASALMVSPRVATPSLASTMRAAESLGTSASERRIAAARSVPSRPMVTRCTLVCSVFGRGGSSVAASAPKAMTPMRSSGRMPPSATRSSRTTRSSAPGTSSIERLRSTATSTVSLSTGRPTSSPAATSPSASTVSPANRSLTALRAVVALPGAAASLAATNSVAAHTSGSTSGRFVRR